MMLSASIHQNAKPVPSAPFLIALSSEWMIFFVGIRRLQGIDPPEYRLRVGDWRVRFHLAEEIVRVLRVRNRREAYR
jgi:hypothetical protein